MSAILPLRLDGASVMRRGKRLVGPVDLTVEGHGVTMVIGPNGSGKTSLLRLMHGLERAREGRVSWASPVAEAQARQAFVFQAPIMMRRSVTDSIAYPLRLSGQRRAEARAAAAEAARAVGLGHALDLPATSISGGEKQKLALARALIRRPEVLFLDEPCANLDGRATREIEDILTRARETGTRIVMSTHDMGQARRLADEVVFLVRGRILEHCPVGRFFSAPATEEAKAFIEGGIVE